MLSFSATGKCCLCCLKFPDLFELRLTVLRLSQNLQISPKNHIASKPAAFLSLSRLSYSPYTAHVLGLCLGSQSHPRAPWCQPRQSTQTPAPGSVDGPALHHPTPAAGRSVNNLFVMQILSCIPTK